MSSQETLTAPQTPAESEVVATQTNDRQVTTPPCPTLAPAPDPTPADAPVEAPVEVPTEAPAPTPAPLPEPLTTDTGPTNTKTPLPPIPLNLPSPTLQRITNTLDHFHQTQRQQA